MMIQGAPRGSRRLIPAARRASVTRRPGDVETEVQALSSAVNNDESQASEAAMRPNSASKTRVNPSVMNGNMANSGIFQNMENRGGVKPEKPFIPVIVRSMLDSSP